jgi:hypothetical protein
MLLAIAMPSKKHPIVRLDVFYAYTSINTS